MTQDISATSTQGCCPYIEIYSKQTSGCIAIALGGIFLVSGVFLALAAHNILPSGVNAISGLGIGGYILGYATVIAGSFIAAYGLWKASSQKDLHQSVINAKPQEDVQDSADQGNEWNKQIKKAAKIDTKGRGGEKEAEQTFEAFETSAAMKANAKRNVLNIVIMDAEISEEEEGILKIVSEYLEVIHGVTVTLTKDYILSDTSRRQRQYAVGSYQYQYSFEHNLSPLMTNLPKNAFVMGFTSKDLYPYELQNSMNFIFGAGSWKHAAGLFSCCRMRDSSFETNLIRLMELASHEFGHMRGLEHCVKYACCMQSTNSLPEFDATPLTFCALDMAKICCINGWSLKKGYQGQLDFFKGFGKKYGKKVNFSQEIRSLERKIQILELDS